MEEEEGEGSLLIPGTLNDYSSLLNCLYFHSSRSRRLFEVLISTLDPESIVTLHKLLPRIDQGARDARLQFGRVIISHDISLSIDNIARVLK